MKLIYILITLIFFSCYKKYNFEKENSFFEEYRELNEVILLKQYKNGSYLELSFNDRYKFLSCIVKVQNGNYFVKWVNSKTKNDFYLIDTTFKEFYLTQKVFGYSAKLKKNTNLDTVNFIINHSKPNNISEDLHIKYNLKLNKFYKLEFRSNFQSIIVSNIDSLYYKVYNLAKGGRTI